MFNIQSVDPLLRTKSEALPNQSQIIFCAKSTDKNFTAIDIVDSTYKSFPDGAL